MKRVILLATFLVFGGLELLPTQETFFATPNAHAARKKKRWVARRPVRRTSGRRTRWVKRGRRAKRRSSMPYLFRKPRWLSWKAWRKWRRWRYSHHLWRLWKKQNPPKYRNFRWQPSFDALVAKAKATGLRPNVLKTSLRAFTCAARRGKVYKRYLIVIDYSLPSTRRRLWLFNLARNTLVFNEWVSHGKFTGKLRARRFSNRMQSLKSSLGVYVTGETYMGKHGYSLRLDGLEWGYNHNARKRAIVVHGAKYVSTAWIRRRGMLGQSWGCPAVRKGISKGLIRRIRRGSIVVGYYPHAAWLKRSRYLNCGK